MLFYGFECRVFPFLSHYFLRFIIQIQNPFLIRRQCALQTEVNDRKKTIKQTSFIELQMHIRNILKKDHRYLLAALDNVYCDKRSDLETFFELCFHSMNV